MSKITGVYKLLSALSHIGTSEGIDSFLNSQNMIVDGGVEEIFVYSGNAIRGALRDAGMKYFLKGTAGGSAVDNSLFYLLSSGGSISGEQKTDIEKARKIRETIPLVGILGGGIGTMLLSGKINVSDGYPICKETKDFIPVTNSLSWRQLTNERSYTRFDDSKNFDMQKYMQEPPNTQKEKKQGEASTQMRYSVEVLVPGAEIYSMIDEKIKLTEVELGCLLSCIYEMSKTPYLGGKSNIGMGRYELDYKLDGEDFILVNKQGEIKLSENAKRLLKLYDDHIQNIDVEGLKI